MRKVFRGLFLLSLIIGMGMFAQQTQTDAAAGDIINLNFGINNSYPWIQTVCGDIRMDNGITNQAPYGQSTIITDSSCQSPGIVFSGDATANFGQGQASSTNQVVGGTTYPEVYTPPSNNGIFSSYTNLDQKAHSGGLTTTNLASVCTLSNCTLPANLQSGVYQANGNVTLNTYTVQNNRDLVFLINGNLTINGNIITPTTSTSFFSVSGNIIVPASVGSAPSTTTANLSGIFSTDRSFIMQTTGACTDLRLNVEGTIIVNAGRTGGQVQNNRDLCSDNGYYPTLSITQRLDFILNLPDIIKTQTITSQEVAP